MQSPISRSYSPPILAPPSPRLPPYLSLCFTLIPPLQVVALSEMGYLKGGTEGCMIIAHGDRWAGGEGGGEAAPGGAVGTEGCMIIAHGDRWVGERGGGAAGGKGERRSGWWEAVSPLPTKHTAYPL